MVAGLFAVAGILGTVLNVDSPGIVAEEPLDARGEEKPQQWPAVGPTVLHGAPECRALTYATSPSSPTSTTARPRSSTPCSGRAGTFRENEVVAERVMDSNDLERERGITILAKNTSVRWKGVKINIVDTPGHSDFGGEVERTLMMADGALLLVDAAEGPLPQTRFVLSQVPRARLPDHRRHQQDRPQDARPHEVLSEVFDLFCDLEASDDADRFPTLYAIGKRGHRQARARPTRRRTCAPLFDTILEKVPPAAGRPRRPAADHRLQPRPTTTTSAASRSAASSAARIRKAAEGRRRRRGGQHQGRRSRCSPPSRA